MHKRIPTDGAVSDRQLTIAELLSDGHSNDEIAMLLGIREITVRYHITRAAARIPGDLPPRVRLVLWFRGAGRQILCEPAGAALRRSLNHARGHYRK